MRRCLVELDTVQATRLWKHVAPNLPQPESHAEALATLHLARTGARSVPFRHRAYSHSWLKERGLPSNLPDRLRPRAERMYPRIVEAVGFAPNFRSPILKPIREHVIQGVCERIEECYAEKRTDPEFVKQQILETKDRIIKRLVGMIK